MQRRRWTAGSLQCAWNYAPRLVKKSGAQGRDIGMLYLGNFLNYVGIISVLVTITQWWMRGIPIQEKAVQIAVLLCVYVVLFALFCVLSATALYAMEGKLCRRAVPSILGFPVFMASWFPINLYACLTPPPKWKIVPRAASVEGEA